MNDQLVHLWCPHCDQSLCGMTSASGLEPQLDDDPADEGLECIVCADLRWSSRRKDRCLRVTA